MRHNGLTDHRSKSDRVVSIRFDSLREMRDKNRLGGWERVFIYRTWKVYIIKPVCMCAAVRLLACLLACLMEEGWVGGR